MRGVFQATIVDESGNILSECNIEARDEVSGNLVQVYDAYEGGGLLGNPHAADANGFTQFYLDSGLYRIRAYLGEFERTWRHVLVGAGPLADEVQELLDTEIASDSYTGALTGLTASVGTAVTVRKAGDIVCLSWAAASGTSNTNALTITGMPAAYRPLATRQGIATVVNNNSTLQFGTVDIETDGTLTFHVGAASGVFTTSGGKGIPAGLITYPI